MTMTFKCLLAAIALHTPWLIASVSAQSSDLIPRKLIFGNPSRTAATISPDGKQLAFLAPSNGVLNVWVAPIGALDQARVMTDAIERPIRNVFWASDSSRILYLQDKGGNENWTLYGVEVAGGKQTQYTNFEKTQVRVINVSPKMPDTVLIGVNNRDPRFHDVHRLNLRTGQIELMRTNDAYIGFTSDWDQNLVLGTKPTPDGGFAIERITADGKTIPFTTVPADDALTTDGVGVTADGKTVYMEDSRGRDTAALTAVDLASGKISVVATNARADISGVMRNPKTGEVEAYSVNYLKTEWLPVGNAVKDDIAFLNREAKGEWNVTSKTLDNRLWTVAIDRVTEPAAFFLYDRDAKKLTKLFTIRPGLEAYKLAPMVPVEIKTRDGLTLVSYLSLPVGAAKEGGTRPDKPLPMVLNVHGGPWARDGFGYHPEHQWLANRGYAVLSVNYRGSTGFGKNFVNASNFQFAGKMHDDLIDAVNWAITQGITTRDKVAIYGGSYGGYATLTGMTFTPDVFACGVDIVGPSNLVTLIESFPEYWKPILEATWYRRVGDPRTDDGKKALLARSPITRVDSIKKPLLIAQGGNDPRVVQKESDQIVGAMKDKKIPVAYILYPDEGHGFARPENRTSFYAISEAFLSQCLGGRYEPIGNDFSGSSLKVLEGASLVPGLKDTAGSK